jgi:hypothetical protein
MLYKYSYSILLWVYINNRQIANINKIIPFLNSQRWTCSEDWNFRMKVLISGSCKILGASVLLGPAGVFAKQHNQKMVTYESWGCKIAGWWVSSLVVTGQVWTPRHNRDKGSTHIVSGTSARPATGQLGHETSPTWELGARQAWW